MRLFQRGLERGVRFWRGGGESRDREAGKMEEGLLEGMIYGYRT